MLWQKGARVQRTWGKRLPCRGRASAKALKTKQELGPVREVRGLPEWLMSGEQEGGRKELGQVEPSRYCSGIGY